MSVFRDSGRHANLPVEDSAAVDSFGRLRVSQATPLFENKSIHSRNEGNWQERTSGASSSITHLSLEAGTQLQCGTGATDYAIRQSQRYFPYAPGRSHLVNMTFVLGDPKTDVVCELGYGDASNGVFLERTSEQTRFFVRSSVTGSVVETNQALQSEWNLDKLDGTGPSGVTLDLTTSKILLLDLQWLGVGTVRVGFNIGGRAIYCHKFSHDDGTGVYMATPSLPARYKIYNTGAVASVTTIKEICTAVSTEGGYLPPGIEYGESHLITARVPVTTRRPIFAIRLKAEFGGGVTINRKTVKLIDAGFSTVGNNALFEICHVHDPSSITATWIDNGANSAVEFSRDISAITAAVIHKTKPKFVAAGSGQSAGYGSIDTTTLNDHAFISQNYESNNSQVIVFFATAEAGTADCLVTADWLEFD